MACPDPQVSSGDVVTSEHAVPGTGCDTAGTSRSHRVAVVAVDTVVSFELAAVVHILQSVDISDGAPRYDVGVVGPPRAVTTTLAMSVEPSAGARGSSFAVVPDRPLEWATTADTVIVPGHASFLDVVPGDVAVLIKEAWCRGARVVSLGVGAFALASVGLLDGRVVTTHWRWADELAERFPRLSVARKQLYVSDATGRTGVSGTVYTAAGAAAVVDVVLHLVEQDHGAVAAGAVARHVVAPRRRTAGQAQYLEHRARVVEDPLEATMRWAEHHLADNVTVSDLARRTHMSTRHFARRFKEVTGATPFDWLLNARVRGAQRLLETTTWSVERVGHESGFGSAGTFRHHFLRVLGTTPARYRAVYNAKVPTTRST